MMHRLSGLSRCAVPRLSALHGLISQRTPMVYTASLPYTTRIFPDKYIRKASPQESYQKADLTEIHPFNPYIHSLLRGMKIIFFSNVHNSLSKRIEQELLVYGVEVKTFEVKSSSDMLKATEEFQYDAILCRFLTKMVPESIWLNRKKPCLIVHPGIPGDRGGSSIDWAIQKEATEWGVTVLEASDVWDGGDIWTFKTFPIRSPNVTKTEMYSGDVTRASVEAALLALIRLKLNLPPQPLKEDDPSIKGEFRPLMKKKDRRIDWNSSADEISRIIQSCDTQPGANGKLQGYERELKFFGASGVQELERLENRMDPGQVIAQKHGAILVACGDGNGIWISHLKDPKSEKPLKLPATMVHACVNDVTDYETADCVYDEIRIERKNTILYVHFDFYNGGMSTEQCGRLERTLRGIKELAQTDTSIQAVVLMGGTRFFSTGIHLNVIEANTSPDSESYKNIVAIDDVIKEIFSMTNIITVSCLQGNAGAGGVMMAAAADLVFAHQGVMLTPTYKAMHLYGSEYWTYFLPKRVGQQKALELTASNASIMAPKALEIGLIDGLIGQDRHEFTESLHDTISRLVTSDETNAFVEQKMQERTDEWYQKLEVHRAEELSKMRECFRSEEYKTARQAFVYH